MKAAVMQAAHPFALHFKPQCNTVTMSDGQYVCMHLERHMWLVVQRALHTEYNISNQHLRLEMCYRLLHMLTETAHYMLAWHLQQSKQQPTVLWLSVHAGDAAQIAQAIR